MKIKVVILSIFAFVTLGLLYSCASDTASNISSNSGSTAAVNNSNAPKAPVNTSTTATDTSAGHDLYAKHCAECHKESGEGGEVVVDGRKMKADNLTDDRRKRLTDEKMIKVMVDGIPDEGMPSYKDKMSEAEMREVVKYVRVDLQKLPPPQPYPNSTVNPQ
jgi:mono/diheme cytochrome c family protein